MARIGWPDQFIEHASSVDHLRKKNGLTVDNAYAQIKAELGDKAVPVIAKQPHTMVTTH